MRLYLWKAGSSFYDFFYCIKSAIYWNRSAVYDARNIYPPLANVFYMLITSCMSVDTLQKMQTTGVNDLKMLQECAFYFLIYSSVLMLFFTVVCSELKKGSRAEKLIFTLTMLFTVPFLYQYERANIIFLALSLTLLFFLWKDSKSLLKRELSFAALACAAGLKIYPAVFGLLLIREKRWKEALRLIAYGIAAFFLPFFCFGGIIGNIKKMIQNMGEVTAEFSSVRIGCQLNYSAILKHLFGWMNQYSTVLIGVFLILAVCFGAIAAVSLEKKWKAILLLTCLLMGVPSFSYTYVGIFMVIPVIAFLDSEEAHGKGDWLYLLGMLLVLLPLPFCWMEGNGVSAYTYLNVTTPMLAEGGAILVMTISLIAEGLISQGKTAKHRICFSGLIAVLAAVSVFINWNRKNDSYDYTNYLKKTLSEADKLKDGDCLIQEFTSKQDTIDKIVLKLNPGAAGVLECEILEKESGSVVTTALLAGDLKNGYQELTFDDCAVEKGNTYQVRLKLTEAEESSWKIYHTAKGLEYEDAHALLNGEEMGWYLGLQVYQR